MSNVFLPLQLAPTTLNQPILPNWGFSLFNINLGASSNPESEFKIIQDVGSYGKQIGHLAEAMEIVIRRLNLLEAKDISPEDRDTLQVFLCDVAKVRAITKK